MSGYFGPVSSPVRTPGVVTAARVLLYILGAFAVVGLVSGLVGAVDAFVAGMVVGAEVPGVVALVLAVFMRRGRGWVRWLVVGDCALYVLMSLGALRMGDPRGLTQLALPVVLLVLVNLRAAREYFRG